MLSDLLKSISKKYIAYGATDFRKQIDSLCLDVKSKQAVRKNKKKDWQKQK